MTNSEDNAKLENYNCNKDIYVCRHVDRYAHMKKSLYFIYNFYTW